MSTRDEILADIAHGLQTPLAVLKAELDHIAENGPCDERMRHCDRIIDNMSLLVRDTMRLVEARSLAETLVRKPFDLSICIEDLVESAYVIARAGRIDFSSNIKPRVWVEGSMPKISEAILNVLSNAIKYTRRSGKERRVSVQLAEHDECAEIVVADTGIGIPPEELPNVFTRYFRTTPGVKHTTGTGLGLAITKGIIDAHGGTIEVESEVGKGTCVRISLPLKG